MNSLQRAMWYSRTGSLKSIRPIATTGREKMGSVLASQVLVIADISSVEIIEGSVKISTESNPIRAICSRPVTVSTPAWLNALLMIPSFMS